MRWRHSVRSIPPTCARPSEPPASVNSWPPGARSIGRRRRWTEPARSPICWKPSAPRLIGPWTSSPIAAPWRNGSTAPTTGHADKPAISSPGAPRPGAAVFLIGESVVLASDPARAAEALARIDAPGLDEAELRIYEGAVLNLAGQSAAAAPLLELTVGSTEETEATRWERAVAAWWSLVDRGPFDARLAGGLLAAYRGLEAQEPSDGFWQRRRDARIGADTHRARAGRPARRGAGTARGTPAATCPPRRKSRRRSVMRFSCRAGSRRVASA